MTVARSENVPMDQAKPLAFSKIRFKEITLE